METTGNLTNSTVVDGLLHRMEHGRDGIAVKQCRRTQHHNVDAKFIAQMRRDIEDQLVDI